MPEPLEGAGSRIMIEGEEARHMAKALRLREGSMAEVCDGLGNTVECEITSMDARRQRAWVGNEVVI